MNPTIKGLAAEGEFMKFASMQGWQLAKPLAHDLPYDFLCLIRDNWARVQVKSTYTSSKGYREVNFRRGRSAKRTAYESGDFDYLFVFCPESQKRYWITMGDLAGTKSCVIVSAERWRIAEV